MSTVEPAQRAYPVEASEANQRLFTFGVLHDVATVLTVAGFPPVTNGRDLVELQLALFRFLYGPPAVTA